MPIAVLREVSKSYRFGAIDVAALTSINIDIFPNRFTVLSGPSGSGKTTLLNMVGCIDRSDSGEVIIADQPIRELSDDALADFRAKSIGFVFQTFNLIPVLTAYENVELPLQLIQMPAAQRRERVTSLLNEVGLSERAHHLPGQMSGGQRQRVAVARALVRSPALVLADEPTANLDSQTGMEIIALMRRLQREHQVSFIFSSHDPGILAAANDVVRIHDGRIVAVERDRKIEG